MALDRHDDDGVAAHLGAYAQLLRAHIRKEDEILYPWMDRELSTSQVGDLFSRFAAVDQAAGPGFTDRYTGLVADIEQSVESRQARQSEVIATRNEAGR
jgi:hemerythrin-like domain-containing protein